MLWLHNYPFKNQMLQGIIQKNWWISLSSLLSFCRGFSAIVMRDGQTLFFFFFLQKTLTRFMGIITRHSLFSTFCVLLFFFLNSFPYAVGFILFTSLHLNRTVNTLPVLLLLNLRIVFFLNWEMCVLYPEKVSGYFNIEPKERVSRYSIRVLTATNLLAFYLNRYGNSGRTELLFFFFLKKKGKDYWFLVILEGSSSTPG